MPNSKSGDDQWTTAAAPPTGSKVQIRAVPVLQRDLAEGIHLPAPFTLLSPQSQANCRVESHSRRQMQCVRFSQVIDNQERRHPKSIAVRKGLQILLCSCLTAVNSQSLSIKLPRSRLQPSAHSFPKLMSLLSQSLRSMSRFARWFSTKITQHESSTVAGNVMLLPQLFSASHGSYLVHPQALASLYQLRSLV